MNQIWDTVNASPARFDLHNYGNGFAYRKVSRISGIVPNDILVMDCLPEESVQRKVLDTWWKEKVGLVLIPQTEEPSIPDFSGFGHARFQTVKSNVHNGGVTNVTITKNYETRTLNFLSFKENSENFTGQLHSFVQEAITLENKNKNKTMCLYGDPNLVAVTMVGYIIETGSSNRSLTELASFIQSHNLGKFKGPEYLSIFE